MHLNPVGLVALILSFVCLVLSIVGIATNEWMICQRYLSGTSCGKSPWFPQYMGLWYWCSDNECFTWYYWAYVNTTYVPNWVQAADAFAIMSLITLTVCCGICLVMAFSKKHNSWAGLGICITGLCASGGYCITVVVFWTCAFDYLIDYGDDDPPFYMSGYSLILVAVSSGLLVIVWILGIVGRHVHSSHDSSSPSSHHQQPSHGAVVYTHTTVEQPYPPHQVEIQQYPGQYPSQYPQQYPPPSTNPAYPAYSGYPQAPQHY